MQYLLTELSTHIDMGFGVTADAFREAAEFLNNAEQYKKSALQQIDMPIHYLYRHSIELYLKSLIIIFHRRLKLPYGKESFDSKPKILVDNKWKELDRCHYIDSLYLYWSSLFTKNLPSLKILAPQGDWRIPPSFAKHIPLICKYDKYSTYFRYPITRNAILDSAKYSMKRFSPEELADLLQDTSKNKPKEFILAIKNERGEIIDAFRKDHTCLKDLLEALKEISYLLNCIHVMTRMRLCSGL